MATLTYVGSLVRVLVVQPTSRGFGYVVMEGPDQLVDWGIKEARENKNSRCLHQIRGLVQRYQPMVLIMENVMATGGQRSERVRELIQAISSWAKDRLEVHPVSRQAVKRIFAPSGAVSKDEIARVVTRYLPELGFRLPPVREAWLGADPRMSIFDSAAMALTYYAKASHDADML